MLIKLLKPFSFVPALLLMYLIFSFSAQDGDASSALSLKTSHKIVQAGASFLDMELTDSEVNVIAERFEGTLRKIAHMMEYFALAVSVAFPLYVYGMHGIWLMLCAGMICVAFACGDEYHQSFVSGRSPSVQDVGIDSFGVFWGLMLVRIVGWTGRHTIFRTPPKRERQEDADYEDDLSEYLPIKPQHNSDSLSEDMSFKKLLNEFKNPDR